jgi:hypothetical protein
LSAGFSVDTYLRCARMGEFLNMRPHEYLRNRLDTPGEYIEQSYLIFDERALYYHFRDKKKANQ